MYETLRCESPECERSVVVYDGKGGHWCATHGFEQASDEKWAAEATTRRWSHG